MLSTYYAGLRALVAGTAIALVVCTTVSNAAEAIQIEGPPRTVPTNLPGVRAFTQPPAAFDARLASDEELAAWGYPARPNITASSAERARWEQQVNPTLRRIVPYLEQREGRYHRPVSGLTMGERQSRTNTIAATSSNWSGMVLVPASGAQPYSSVRSAWIVPAVKQAPGTCSGNWDYSSQWVGLGGFNDAFLLQAGSAANVFCDIGGNIPEYFPWIEWLPAAETVLYENASHALLPFASGDYVVVTITATNWNSGVSTSGTLVFVDNTQGWSVSLTFTAASLGGSQVTGQAAEWIVERTDVNGSFATLPDYVANAWAFARAQDLGAAYHYPGTPGTSSAYQLTMLDDSNADVSYVTLFGANSLWFLPEGSATK